MADGQLSYSIVFDGIQAAVSGLTNLQSTVSNVANTIRIQLGQAQASLNNFGKIASGSGLGAFTSSANGAASAASGLGAAAGGAGGGITNMSNAAGSAGGNLNNMGSAMKGLVGIELAEKLLEVGKAMIELSDESTQAFNRIQASTKTSAEAEGAFDRINQVAIQTRQPLEAVAESFQQVTLATNALGLSYNKQIDITRELNELLVVSGASGQRAKQGVSDLLRGLAAGKITSQELRGLTHDVPQLGQAIAQGLGVGVGALKELAKQGKLTPEAVVGSLQKMAPEVAAQFAKMTPTISGGFQALKDGIEGVIHDFNAFTGAGGGVGAFLQFLGEHAGVVATVLAGVGAVLVASVIPAVVEFGVALLATPLGAIAAAVGLVSAALGVFGEHTFTVAGQSATGWQLIRATIAAAWDIIKPIFTTIGTWYDTLVQKTTGLGSTSESVFQSILGFLKVLANGFIGTFVAIFNSVMAIWNNFPGAMNQLFVKVENLAAAAAEGVLNVWQAPLRGIALAAGTIAPAVASTLNGALDKVSVHLPRAQASKEGKDFGQAVQAGVKSAFNTDYVGKFGNVVTGELKKITAASKAANDSLNDVHGGTAGGGEDDKLKKKKQQVDDYAQEVKKLQNAIYDEGLDKNQLQLADAFDEADLPRNINDTGALADKIRGLVTELQRATAVRQFTDELKKLQQTNYELTLSENERAQVEARIAAGLPANLAITNEQTKAIDAQAAANQRLAASNKAKEANQNAGNKLGDDFKAEGEKHQDKVAERANPYQTGLNKQLETINKQAAGWQEIINKIKQTDPALAASLQAQKDNTVELEKQDAKMDDQNDKTQKLQSFLQNLWNDPMAAMKQFFQTFVTNLLIAIAKATILKGLLGGSGGGGSFGSMVSSALGSALGFGGGKAVGGNVDGSKYYMVGERGPELFAPGAFGGGTIIPNGKMGGGGTSISVGSPNITIHGGASNQTTQDINYQMASWQKSTVQLIRKEMANKR